MQRRHLLAHLGAAGTLLAWPWLQACTPTPRLRLAIHPWIGYETLRLAQAFKWMTPSIELVSQKDLRASSQALESGEVDVACLTLDEVLRIRATRVPLTVVLVFDISEGADMVLAKPAIGSLSDLRGKRIGIEPGPLGALILDKLLAAAHLTSDMVRVMEVSAEQHVDAWRNNAIDAVITYEPTATMLQRIGAYRLYDSRQMPDMIFDVLALRTDRLSGQQGSLRALLAAHFRGLAHMSQYREDATYRIAAAQGMSPDEVRRALTGVMMPSLEANREYLQAEGARILPAARSLSEVMLRTGLLSSADTLADFCSATWLPGPPGG